MAGLEEVPVYVRAADDQGMLEMALVENIQRENLNAIEVAISFKRLMEECNLNTESLAERVGKDRTTVTNYVRLLKLPPEIQMGIIEKRISMGHARALINIPESKIFLQRMFNNQTQIIAVISVARLFGISKNKIAIVSY